MSDFRERLQDLSPAKRALLEKLLRQQAPSQPVVDPIPRLSASARRPLSFAEQRLWFVDQLEPDHPFYNLPLAAKLTGKLDSQAFVEAFQDVIDRHETLRSTYRLNGAEPDRVISPQWNIVPQFVDLRDQDFDQRQLERRLRVESRRPFVLEKGPLIRCTLFQLKDDEYVVLLVMHHIVSDGWSMGVMLRELTLCYESRLRGTAPKLLALPLQYSDFAAWQQQRLTGEFLEREVEHWREKLQHTPALIDLPTSYQRSATQDFEGATLPFEIAADTGQLLQRLARDYQATPFMVLVAAYAVLLSRYARQSTVNIGTAVANRLRPELESLIGFFVNTLVLPIDVQDQKTFAGLIEHVRDVATTAFAHQEVPFEKLVEHLVADRDRSHSPLFQVAFVLQNAPQALTSTADLNVEPVLVDNGTAKSDLTFFLTETGAGRFVGHVEYRTSLFTRGAIEQIVRSYKSLLNAAVRDPQISVAKLPLLDSEQHEQIINGFNDRHAEFSGPRVLHEAVAVQAFATPEKVAVVHRTLRVTYGELEQRTRAMAAALQTRGVTLGQTVAVALPRSIDQVVASIAIMKTGAVYAPIDPEAPDLRVRGILSDIAPRLLISEPERCRAWQSMVDGELEAISVPDLEKESNALDFQPAMVSPNDLAYMIFTSGSTGTPKGVLIEHRGIVNFLRAKALAMEQFGSQDRVMHGFSPCFDGSIAEVFMTLMHGATLVIVDRETFIDPPALTALLNEQQVTVGMFSPTLLSTLDAKAFPHLRIVLSAGEALTPELARRWIPGRAMYNGYGPTEVSIGVSVQRLLEPLGHRVSIGSAMANMRMYLLDSQLQPVPIGVVGEIYVGGVGVARGYLNRPELTDERFLPDPFNAITGARMYRTGDLGRWREDGTAEFVSRRDDQIKLRGFRIELGEIESALNALPYVRRSVVVAWGDDSESRRLVAYVVPDHESSESTQSKLQREQVANWRELFEESHRAAGPKLDREFDIAGWASTYTGRALPQTEMRAWVDATVQRILKLNPRRVLEIGCGTGLILLPVAPHCEAYVGTDILTSSLVGIEQALQRYPETQSKVRLYEQAADDFSQLGTEQFDVIILNSVAQYFPNAEYLHRVIQQAMTRLAPGGKLFLGDLRNHTLHEAWATSVELYRADSDTDMPELRRRVLTRIEREEELLINPLVFREIARQSRRGCVAEIQLKHLECDNELSRYRYDVTLHLDQTETVVDEERIDASDLRAQPDRLTAWIKTRQPTSVRLVGLTNARVHDAFLAWQMLQQPNSFTNKSEIEQFLSSNADHGVEPNAYFALADALGYEAEVTWNEISPDQFDVKLTKYSHKKRESAREVVAKEGSSLAMWVGKTNDPLRWKASQQSIAAWRAALHERLPDYMVPTSFVLLDEIPFTVQGKVNKEALPPPPTDRPEWAGNYVAPRDEAETVLVRIWEDLLEVRPIGVRDSFFALGGHSMLAVRMVSEVQSQTGNTLPLAALFRNPTIEHLANILNDPAAAAQSASLVPLNSGVSGSATQLTLPLFCIHPAGGTVFCYREFAAQYEGRREVYGLQALGIDGLHTPHETLGEMAAHYVRSIRDVQTNGPYHLLGWSIGGVIAFEVARQLREQGESIGRLTLLDAGLLPGTDAMKDGDFLPLMAALFPGKEALSLEALRQLSMEEQVRYFTERAAQAGIVPPGYEQLSGHIFDVFQANVKAVHEYLPQKFRGSMTLIRPEEQAKTSEVFDDPVLGWRPYVDAIDVQYVPGDHAHMLQAPAVQSLVRLLDRS